jgi:hypothetical protein
MARFVTSVSASAARSLFSMSAARALASAVWPSAALTCMVTCDGDVI